MIVEWGAAIDRNRRSILVAAALLTAVVLGARWSGTEPDHLAGVLAVPLAATILLIIVVGVAPAWRRPGLVVLEAERAFRTRPTGIVSLFGAAHLMLLGMLLLYPDQLLHGTFQERIVLPAAALSLAFYARGAWHGIGLTITAGGVRSDKYVGSLTVPWNALDPDRPPTAGKSAVEISCLRPDLARASNRWVGRDDLVADGLSPERIALVLRHYLAVPAARTRIGTAEEHERLVQLIVSASPVRDDDEDDDEPDEPWTGRRLAVVIGVALVLFAAVVVASTLAEEWFGDGSAAELLVHLAAAPIVVGLGSFVVHAVKGFRRDRRR